MADLGGIAGLLNAVVQRSVERPQSANTDDVNDNRTRTESAGTTASAGAGTTSAANAVGEGLAFRPIESTGTDQNTNSEFTNAESSRFGGRVIVDQVSISAQARAALEEAQAGGTTSRNPAEAVIEEATNPATNLAFRSDAARDAATVDGSDGGEAVSDRPQTNQVETNERDTGVVIGNTDVTASSSQSRELGQLVDQFA